MQPYIFPYIGYFQLMYVADVFVVYDNIEYTKKGWINRNRILANDKDEYLTLPLKKGSDFVQVRDRFLADTWKDERKKLLNKISVCYKKAPCYPTTFSLIENVLMFEDDNLFNFIFNSLKAVKEYLDLSAQLVVSSSINIDHTLKSESKVLAICKALGATQYINPIGGVELYNKEVFKNEGLELSFLKANNITYPQFQNEFVPFLSVVDVLMFNDKETIQKLLEQYILL